MRELIQPVLLLGTRLGLFLSVTTWIAAHWWTVSVTFSPASSPITMTVNHKHLLVVMHRGSRNLWTVQWQERADTGTGIDMAIWMTDRASIEMFHVPDSILTIRRSPVRYLLIHHGLIATLCALLYAVLKWMYREQRMETAR